MLTNKYKIINKSTQWDMLAEINSQSWGDYIYSKVKVSDIANMYNIN